MLPVLHNNTGAAYCTVIAKISDTPGKPENTYIKGRTGQYIAYDPNRHDNADQYFVKQIGSDYEVSEANWEAENSLCRLKPRVYIEFPGLFLILSLFYSIVMIILLAIFRQIFGILKM